MCEEVGFEIGKELSARHVQKRLDLERGARIWSLEEPKRWGMVSQSLGMKLWKLRSDSLALTVGGRRSVRVDEERV